MNQIPTIPRCVVTGFRNGKSTITKDGNIENISEHIPGLVISDVWATDTMPVKLDKTIQIENTLLPLTPKNGTYVRYVEIPPDSIVEKYLPKQSNSENDVHPLMHKTDTLDYIIILSGELYLILEDGETLLKPGDIVVQRGTMHAWSNRSDKPCIQLAILIDAER